MYRKSWMIRLFLLLLLGLMACAQDEPQATATETAPPATATNTPQPTATPTPTVTPSPTPVPQPAVEVIDQAVDEEGEVVVSRVFTPDGGWIVVYAAESGDAGSEPGTVLGHTAVEAGEQLDVTVTVDPYLVTPTLFVRLHADTGEVGVFDFPEADEVIEVDGEGVGARMAIDLRVSPPGLTVSDQVLGTDGLLVIDTVTAAAEGWVAVHRDDEGRAGEMLGLSPVTTGETNDVTVHVNWREVTRQLHAVLYADGGEPGFVTGEDSEDSVVRAGGQPVQAAFTIQAPPDVYVINQPVVAPEIVVDRAYVNEPGWIVVYSNYEGFTDRLLGHAPLEAGENRLVTVPIEASNTTDILHILLHEDGGVEGQFDNPVDDPPLRDEEGQPIFFSFETDTGNYVITRDQALGAGNTVVVPLVVSDLATWVTVWSDEESAPGEILGQTVVERGVQRDVVVQIDGAAATEMLWVVLHQDAGELGEFEYPGVDEILQREREPIQAPFVVKTGD